MIILQRGGETFLDKAFGCSICGMPICLEYPSLTAAIFTEYRSFYFEEKPWFSPLNDQISGQGDTQNTS